MSRVWEAGRRTVAALCPALLLAAAAGPDARAESPPNVVLIISDDQGWGDYGFMGHPQVETPQLDRLAAESLAFTRGYVPSSLCRPSLASIITGLHPFQHRITSNDPALALRQMPGAWEAANAEMGTFIRGVETLPRVLGERLGYLSFQAGKWWEGAPENGGFSRGMSHGDPARGGRHGDDGLKVGREGLGPVFEFVREARAAGKPFFLWYAPFLPHSPHTAPEALVAKYRERTGSEAVARYWACVEWFDQTCGELLGFIDDQGLRGDTLVAYVCDNGWIQDPDRPDRYAERSKRSPYDGGIRTPVMVRWPGHAGPQTDTTTPVLSTDIAPTILAACGLAASPGMTGVNLLDPAALAARPRISGDVYLHNAVDLGRPASSLNYRWVIEGDTKLISPFPPNAPGSTTQLYRITEDPHERNDLAASEPARAAGLTRALDAWLPLPAY